MSGEIERRDGGPLPPAWRQSEHGIEPIPERWPRERDLPARDGGPGFTRPDFILAGARLPDGRFRLVASRKVHDSELSCDYGRVPAFEDLGVLAGPVMMTPRITLKAELGHFMIVEGPDYGTCMAEVARCWRDEP